MDTGNVDKLDVETLRRNLRAAKREAQRLQLENTELRKRSLSSSAGNNNDADADSNADMSDAHVSDVDESDVDASKADASKADAEAEADNTSIFWDTVMTRSRKAALFPDDADADDAADYTDYADAADDDAVASDDDDDDDNDADYIDYADAADDADATDAADDDVVDNDDEDGDAVDVDDNAVDNIDDDVDDDVVDVDDGDGDDGEDDDDYNDNSITDMAGKFVHGTQKLLDGNYKARVTYNGKPMYFGTFVLQTDAARMYDKVCKVIDEDFKKTNKPRKSTNFANEVEYVCQRSLELSRYWDNANVDANFISKEEIVEKIINQV
ncbi:predicted protein [Chaetoceros tenuissimus]|uniref:AP2/ERF domain-containing protein n=1 Tax=Chaetoceros tenuissimus TaxID=426638 RepID=A0AAD3D5Z5_9STRA|nr:predicted protein [Chaetoceros tenuissimus]